MLLLLALSGCTSVLGISDPTPAGVSDGGADSSIDSHIDAPPACAMPVSLKAEISSDVGVTGTGFVISRFDQGLPEDIAIATGANVVILHGNRTGVFGGDGQKITIPTPATDLVVDDFDSDGDDDFVLWTKGGTSVVVQRQNRAKNPPVEDPQPLDGTFTSVQKVINTLLDGASVPDLLVYDGGAGSRPYTALLGTPGTFARGATLVGTGADELVLVAPIDPMQRDDAMFVNGTTVKLALQPAATGFGNPVNVANGVTSKAIAVGKFDGDSLPDFVVSTSAGLVLYRQNAASPGTFQMHGVISPVQAPSLLVADVNQDGRDDLIAPTAAILQCAPAVAGGAGVFTQVEPLTAPQPAKFIDVNGDDKPDLVWLDGTSVKVRLQ